MAANKILVIEDDKNLASILTISLAALGHYVTVAGNGEEGIERFISSRPDLVLLDIGLPGMDGFHVCEKLRQTGRYGHVPIIMLTARAQTADKIRGLNAGADDYISKPFDIDELLARIRAHLNRSLEERSVSPLTDLPGNIVIDKRIGMCLEKSDLLWAVFQTDLDNFKAYNDAYGVTAGDEVIQMTAQAILDVVDMLGNKEDFVGHIGGDDFIVVTTPDKVTNLCEGIVREFDRRIVKYYSKEALENGQISCLDRLGKMRDYPIMTISIGVATNLYRNFSFAHEVTRVTAEMKQLAKSYQGSNFRIDRRGRGQNEDEDCKE